MSWRRQSIEALQAELDQLVLRIEPRLPTIEDYGLPVDRQAALREVEQLLAGALNPNEYVDEANLLYLKARFLTELGLRQRAKYALWNTEALRAFFDSKDQALWLEVRWQRIKILGEQRRWLAFERALSELIGWIRPSRCEDYSRDLSAARYARGLCYQLRGLTCDVPETMGILLAAGLRDLEQVTGPEHVSKAIVPWDRSVAITVARDSISQWQQDPGNAKAIAPNWMPNTMGLLRFSDWPQDQQAIFLSGANRTARGRFFAEPWPYGILFVLVLFLGLSFAFALGFGGLFTGPFIILRILAYVPAVFMVVNAVRIGRDLWTYRQQKKVGAIVYGFLIDAERLAVRTIEAFSDETYFWGENSVLLPIEQIQGSLISRKATYPSAGRMKHVDVLVIRYRDEWDQLQRVTIPDRFNLPVRKIDDLLQVLKHDLVGTWENSGDKKIQFDQDTGTVTDYGKVFHFRWREIEGGAISVTALPDSTDGFESGIYHFELKAKGSSLELAFLEGFGGRYLKDFKRTGKHGKTGMKSARVAMRLAASEPLPELGP